VCVGAACARHMRARRPETTPCVCSPAENLHTGRDRAGVGGDGTAHVHCKVRVCDVGATSRACRLTPVTSANKRMPWARGWRGLQARPPSPCPERKGREGYGV